MPRSADPPNQPHRERSMGCQAAIRFRLAIGLAHAVRGAELKLRRADGGELVAANRPDADLNLCGLRRLVLGQAGPLIAERWIDVVEIGGVLAATNDGLWSSGWPEAKRWFATTLRQDQVAMTLAELETSDIGEEGIEVVLKPDPCLGVTAVGVSAMTSDLDPELSERRNELARRAHGACMVHELIGSIEATAIQAQTMFGHRSGVDVDDGTKGER